MGLIYSYSKNKEALFDEIVRPVILNLPETLREVEASPDNGLANRKPENLEHAS